MLYNVQCCVFYGGCVLIFNIAPVFSNEGKRIDIGYVIPSAETDEYPRTGDIAVKGSVVNRTGIVTLSVECSYDLTALCDRCAEEFTEKMTQTFTHQLIKKLEDEYDDFIEVPTGELDLDELLREDIILELPYLFLCKEDCKGLCAQCGTNLNNGSCACKQPVDPRLSALLDFLD